ncbi:unnamed protein product [Parajaminaea phylloscopi]
MAKSTNGPERSGSKSAGKPSRPNAKPYPRRRPADQATTAEPGVSKIKAALRQTTRLLAKDNLAQDVRQEAERRLASLESDLALRESSAKERKNAERYHKVRFFERQKLVRQIKKLKKRMADVEGEDAAALQADLEEKRVLLHYVLTFPTSLKYVALFPSSGDSPFTKPSEVGQETETSRRHKATYEQAMSVRDRVRAAMASGDLSSEPEVELERGGDRSSNRLDGDKVVSRQAANSASARSAQCKSSRAAAKQPKKGEAPGIEQDDFFAQDSGSDD